MKQATMNGYFYVLTAIDLFVLSFMCILTKLSESLNKKQKQGFFFAFALIAVISVLEVVTLAVDGTPAGYRWLNILSNYLGFGLSPGVCLCLVYVMDRKQRMNRWFRAAVCCEACYLLFLALSNPKTAIFVALLLAGGALFALVTVRRILTMLFGVKSRPSTE